MSDPMPRVLAARYEVTGVLGRGGMGVVYAAFDRERGQQVALKRLSSERFAEGRARERARALFEREYHALSQLEHPHIIRAYDFGIDEQGPFYSMELLTGQNLRDIAPLDWRVACRLVRDIASALSLIHSRLLVHRDVTPLNIHCTPEGRAKLIDFGAMVPAGVPKHLIGTPAFIPPESLQLQSLDGQADLFALGASLYFAITGQHAYPARTVAALQEVWLTPPIAPSQRVPEVPEALDDLVLSMLSLSPSDRPRTAAEVYERLSAIAELPREEELGTAQAFLTRPALIGRASEVAQLRQRAEHAFRGRGGAVALRGEHGMGRSRLLDAAALEARLCGFRVARTGATLGREEPLAAARSLLGALAAEHADLARCLAEQGVEQLEAEGAVLALDQAQRERTLQRIADALLAACALQPCALIVDDLQDVDDTSCALLASLAERAHAHALWIVASMEAGASLAAGSALGLFWGHARRIAVQPLAAEQSRELLASMFGEVPNIDVLAVLMHRGCEGNPRELVDTARTLVDQKLLHYAGGSWSISNNTDALALAISDRHDLDRRLSRLSEDARELLEAIASDRYGVIDAAYYPELLGHAARARMHDALQVLVQERWVALHEDGVRFLREDLRDGVTERIPGERRRQLHAQLAERCAAQGLPAIFETHHRLAADQPEQALRAADAFNLFVEKHPTADVLRHPVTLETTDAVSRMPSVPGEHPARRAKYAGATLLNASYVGRTELVAARLAETLALFAPLTGVGDYAALAELPPQDRLVQALTRAAARCEHPGPGGFDVVSALRRQTQLCITTTVTSNFMADPALLEIIPDFSAFFPLSPALPLAARMIGALSKLARGQTWLAWDALDALHAELRALAPDQLEPLTRMMLERTTTAYLCGLAAEHGAHDTLELLEAHGRAWPDLAENQRSRYFLALGDLSAAAAARRRFEVLSVLAGGMADTRVIELPWLLSIFALCNDTLALRRTLTAIAEVAERRPGWRPRELLARAQLARCQGELTRSLDIVESVLPVLQLPHPDYVQAASLHVELLSTLRRRGEAVERGHAYLHAAKAAQLPLQRIQIALAQALADEGLHDEAESLFADALAALEKRAVCGVLLGHVYEVGARIALARDDRAAFEGRAELCAQQFKLGRHPALTVRYNALMRDAARHERIERIARSEIGALQSVDLRAESLLQLALQPIEDPAFYRAVLELLLQASAAVGGVLYRAEPTRLRRVASEGPIANQSQLDELAARCSAEPGDVRSDGLTLCVLKHEDAARCGVAILDGAAGEPERVARGIQLASMLMAARARAGSQLASIGASQLSAGRNAEYSEAEETATQDIDDASSH